MNHPISRPRSALGVGEGWTAADATELYEIARWGKGYFSIGDNGQVKIHPTKDASRSIDLKQLVDDLRHRGADADPVSRRPAAPAQGHLRSVPGGDRPARLLGPLRLRLPDQGQSAA